MINRKLKSLYFQWAINYFGPPPRSLASNFEEHLKYEKYDFDKNWLNHVLQDCEIASKEEFEEQVLLIENEFEKYSNQQNQKIERQRDKKFKKLFAKNRVTGSLLF